MQKSIIRNFNLMINLLVTSTIMRSKFKIDYLNLASCTCGSFLALIISHLCIRTFDLMIVLVSRKNDHEIKTLERIIREFQPHDRSVDLLIDTVKSWWTNWILTSWSKIQPPEKVEFQSHEIWPPDPESLWTPINGIFNLVYFLLGWWKGKRSRCQLWLHFCQDLILKVGDYLFNFFFNFLFYSTCEHTYPRARGEPRKCL